MHFRSVNDSFVLQNLLLRLVVPERLKNIFKNQLSGLKHFFNSCFFYLAHLFTINTLIENNADTPDINPVIDYWRTVVRARKTFRRKVPVSPGSLRCQLNPVITILTVNYLLRKAEISNFYISTN